MMKNITGKWVYIVGGSSGIGLSAAKRFASMGANVLIFARRESALKNAVEEIKGYAAG